jgi:hypothetical protein
MNGLIVTEAPSPVEMLATLASTSQMIVRLELEDTGALEMFEGRMTLKVEELMNVAALGGLRPTFVWWQVQALWPRTDGGWTLLLRKATFSGTPAPPPARRQVGDGYRGVRG